MSSNPLGPLEVVRTNARCCDPAIARDADLMEYRITRDLSVLTYREGMKPTIFVVQPLSRKFLMGHLEHVANPAMREQLAFTSTCHEIRLSDGQVMTPKKYEDGVAGVLLACDDWTDYVMDEFGTDTVRELGRVALDRARLPKGATRGPFSLLATG